MALVLQNYTRWFMSTIKLASRVSRTGKTKRWCSSHDGPPPSPQFGHSVILLQDGLNIEELPIAVRRANNQFLQMRLKSNFDVPNNLTSAQKNSSDSIFKKCQNPEAVISKLDEFNIDEVAPSLAYHALAKLSELGMNIEYRNQGAELDKSFTIDSVLLQLGNIICKSGTTDNLIGSMKLILLPSFPGRIGSLRKLLAEQCLNRVLDNICNIVQVCQIVEIFSAMQQQLWADKCWVGLMGRKIDEADILRVFKILPSLKESQRAVFNHLERLVVAGANLPEERRVLEILTLVDELRLPHRRICLCLSKWMRLNLHIMTEDGITKMLVLFRRLDYSDLHLVQAMGRFFKSRTSGVQEELIVAASDYFRHFQLCHTVVLNVIANSFSRLGHKKLNVQTVEAVLTAFGVLDFHPENDYAFWSAVEEAIDKRLIEFRPESLLNVFLSCIYLQRYPLNFVPRLFSSHFIHRLHSQTQYELIESCRSKMKLLDAAMSFECGQYGTSHVLPKDYHAKAMARDGRISRAANQLVTPLLQICEHRFNVTASVVLRDLPLNPIYVVDVLISPAGEPAIFRYGYGRTYDNRNCVAILIHPPEHYAIHTTSKKRLVGVQAMRHRHLLLMGFRPVHFDWQELVSLEAKKEMLQLYLDSRIVPLLNDCTRS